MPTIEFLKQLSQRLKTGNLRSVHLNALPGKYATRLDISRFDIIKKGLAKQFFYENLLTRPSFTFRFSFSDIDLNSFDSEQKNDLNGVARKLNSIDYENIDTHLEHGIKSFGFGYPLLIKRDKKEPKRIIKAPLLIWDLDIKKSSRVQNEWSISRDEDYSIIINQVLISYLAENVNINIGGLNEDYLDDGLIDSEELLQISEELLIKIGVKVDKSKFNLDLVPCPSREAIENITPDRAWICWSGILGLYRTQKESLINDIETIIDNYDSCEFEKLKVERYQTSTISSVETDPSQEEIINSLSKSKTKIIQGPPGTGKSQSITAIITNALESKAKCLVVCEKKTALDVIYKNLCELDLGSLCVIIDDVSKDRKRVIDRVRGILDVRDSSFSGFREVEYHEANQTYERIKAELNTKHKAILKRILGDDTWKDIIGKFLKSEKVQSKNILAKTLNYNDYELNYQEFISLSKAIQEGQHFFDAVKTLNHPLDALNDKIFDSEYLTIFKKQIADDLIERSKVCVALVQEIKQCNHNFGPTFYQNRFLNRAAESLFSIFLKKYKVIKFRKDQIDRTVEHLIRLHIGSDNLKFEFPNTNSKSSYLEVADNLVSYHNQIEKVLRAFDSFANYYQWKRFLNSLDFKKRKLLLALIEAKVTDWQTCFTSWYLNGTLAKNEGRLGPFLQNDRLLVELASFKKQLQIKQRDKIITIWRRNQDNSIQNFKTSKGNVKGLYNYKKNSQYDRKNSLRKIIATDFALFTDFFPVVLVNPVACSSILPMKEGLFDIVIFDEASQLRLEDTYSAYLRGKHKIISGDKHQMPPSNYFQGDSAKIVDANNDNTDEEIFDDSPILAESESLLKFAENSDFSFSYLDFHYRSKHPFLIDFSNAAFYGSRLVPMPVRNNYKPIRLVKVNGLYESRTNPAEAQKIAEFLFDKMKPFNDGNYPSIGIATLNIEQRNLILDAIHDHCTKSNTSAQKFEAIQKSGFFVKNLENIQGDEKDIIIISTTFGLNSDGKFREQYGPINNFDKGYKLLNVIITRAKRYLIIFTSIPKDVYSRHVEEIRSKGNLGKGIFYAYLAYAEAIENNDNEKRENVLRLLAEHCAEPQISRNEKFVESSFEQEVYDYLTEHIKKERIEVQYKCGGFRIDFVIKAKKDGRPIIAIECDGAKYHSSEEAYAYDLYRQKQLEQLGFKVYRIWSTNWWHAPQREILKLLDFIKQVDGVTMNEYQGAERLTENTRRNTVQAVK